MEALSEGCTDWQRRRNYIGDRHRPAHKFPRRVTPSHLIYLISRWKIVPPRCSSFRLSYYYSSYRTSGVCLFWKGSKVSSAQWLTTVFLDSFVRFVRFFLFRVRPWIGEHTEKTRWEIAEFLTRWVIPVPWTRFTKVAAICSGVMSRGNMGKRLRLETRIYS